MTNLPVQREPFPSSARVLTGCGVSVRGPSILHTSLVLLHPGNAAPFPGDCSCPGTATAVGFALEGVFIPSLVVCRVVFGWKSGVREVLSCRCRVSRRGGGSAGAGTGLAGAPAVLPDLLQLLPQPGGQRLPQPVQQLGQLHVVLPVVAGQERSGLRGRKSKARWG